jgi:hypothetical protein
VECQAAARAARSRRFAQTAVQRQVRQELFQRFRPKSRDDPLKLRSSCPAKRTPEEVAAIKKDMEEARRRGKRAYFKANKEVRSTARRRQRQAKAADKKAALLAQGKALPMRGPKPKGLHELKNKRW